MSSPTKGPEDQPNWVEAVRKFLFSRCILCKSAMDGKHCAERGCPWCARCGAKTRIDTKGK